MLVLGIDQSTARAVICLWQDGRVLAETSWHETGRIHNQDLFRHLPGVLQAGGRTAAGIELYAAGTGPGSFAGVRTTIAALEAMALPAGTPVVGVQSCDATAHTFHVDAEILVAGDARREHAWLATYLQAADWLCPAEVQLVPIRELAARVGNRRVLSADQDRLARYLPTEPAHPDGAALCELAATRFRHAAATRVQLPRPAPVYLHPPVFVPPRFAHLDLPPNTQ